MPLAHLCAPGRVTCVCCLCSGWAPCPRLTWLLRGLWVLTSSPRKAAPCSGGPRPPGFSPSPCRPCTAPAESPQGPGSPVGWQRTQGHAAVPEQGPVTRWSTNPWAVRAQAAVTGTCPARKRTVCGLGSVLVGPAPYSSPPRAAAGWEEGRQGDGSACGAPPSLTACPRSTSWWPRGRSRWPRAAWRSSARPSGPTPRSPRGRAAACSKWGRGQGLPRNGVPVSHKGRPGERGPGLASALCQPWAVSRAWPLVPHAGHSGTRVGWARVGGITPTGTEVVCACVRGCSTAPALEDLRGRGRSQGRALVTALLYLKCVQGWWGASGPT